MAAMSRPKPVTSADNARYKTLRRLMQSAQARKRAGLSVLDGVRLVAAYRHHAGQPEQLIVSRSGLEDPEVRALVEGMPETEAIVLGDGLFADLSSVVTPTGIMAVVRTPGQQTVPRDMDTCVMLEDLQDPGNLGSILRSCAAAGVRHVLLSVGSAQAWSPRVLRAAMGAHFALTIYEEIDLQAAVRAYAGKRVATRQQARQSVFDADLKGKVAFLFGNEGAGLSRALQDAADLVIAIPMPGQAESLNVAAAAAICLFEQVRQSTI